MSWRLEPTEDLALVLDLHHQVFNDDLQRERIEQRAARQDLQMVLLLGEDDRPAGYGIYLDSGLDVEFWHGGVLPARRGSGAGAALLKLAEARLAEQGYSRMTVSTYNRWNVMLGMLVRRGFRVTGTRYSERRQDLKILLHKELRPHKELRISLTENCNFDCFFCHNEGLGERAASGGRPTEQILEVIREAMDLGHTDLTFTGGEPLMKKGTLFELLTALGHHERPPDVTVVTNGSLLGAEVVARLKAYPGPLKVHVSLHASDEHGFQTVTGNQSAAMFLRVRDNIRRATGAGLMVKMNHVVLQGVNHRPAQLQAAVTLAREVGAAAIKLLELLVIRDNAGDYQYYYDSQAIRREMERAMGPGRQEGRRKWLFHPADDARFTVEVQQLTCQLGCVHCMELRDRTISSSLEYHPCFIRSDRCYAVGSEVSLAQAFEEGNRVIDGFASQYGESSPTLRRKERNVPGRSEVFFRVDDARALAAYLGERGYGLSEKALFHEQYFRPRSASAQWSSFERVLKLSQDSHDQATVDLVYSDHEYLPATSQGGQAYLRTRTRFLFDTGPVKLDGWDAGQRLLDRLDFVPFLELDWELNIISGDPRAGHDLVLSLAEMGDRSTVKVLADARQVERYLELLAGYEGSVAPLLQPLVLLVSEGPGAGQ